MKGDLHIFGGFEFEETGEERCLTPCEWALGTHRPISVWPVYWDPNVPSKGKHLILRPVRILKETQ